MTEKNKEELSRRKFLASAGGVVVGTMMATASLNLSNSSVDAEGTMEWPWPYKKLDPEVVRKKGHFGYYQGACCYGAFSAIIDVLKDEIGYPYTMMPIDMMRYGEGGIVGWTTVCGALNGAAAAITLIAGEDNYKELVNELMGWYTEFEFPSDISNKYAKEHKFLVNKYKSDEVLVQSVSNSPLCHASVTNWCKESDYASGDSERSERCARLTGDVAAKAVELLNASYDGEFVPKYELSGATERCRSCHAKGKAFEQGGWTRGKMGCGSCHEDAHK